MIFPDKYFDAAREGNHYTCEDYEVYLKSLFEYYLNLYLSLLCIQNSSHWIAG